MYISESKNSNVCCNGCRNVVHSLYAFSDNELAFVATVGFSFEDIFNLRYHFGLIHGIQYYAFSVSFSKTILVVSLTLISIYI